VIMSVPRRRLVRPSPVADIAALRRQERIDKLRQQLMHDDAALIRWKSRLRRAFRAMDRLQQKIDRIVKTLATLEGC